MSRMSDLKNQTIAAIRTGWNGAIAAGLSYAVAQVFDVNLDVNDPLIVAVAAPVLGVVNRASNLAFDHLRSNKIVGFILFGIPRTPTYAPKD